MSLYKMLSPYIFKFDCEKTHSVAEWAIKHIIPLPLVQDYAASKYCVYDESLHVEVAGMRFYNPIGLAAGFDKNATMVRGLSALGFGFLEIGTITQTPQAGNPRPRVFRYEESRSLQNEMGFNNHGSLVVARRLRNLYPYSIPIGINVGKNKVIAQKDSLKNYENVLLDCLDCGDYFVFNISSPNTPKLRDLQNVNFVQELFSMARTHTTKPLFVKISPDMNKDTMLKVVETSIKSGANGVIATNTTIDYKVLSDAKDKGGISGEALKEKSKEVLRILGEAFFGKATLISVGGVDDAKEAYERIRLGASLVQVFSGLIFQGPSLCKQINDGLIQCLKDDGYANIVEAIGSGIANRAIKRSRKPKIDSTQSADIKTSKKSETGTKKKGRKPKVSSKEAIVAKGAETGTRRKTRAKVTVKTDSNDVKIPKKRGRPRKNPVDSNIENNKADAPQVEATKSQVMQAQASEVKQDS